MSSQPIAPAFLDRNAGRHHQSRSEERMLKREAAGSAALCLSAGVALALAQATAAHAQASAGSHALAADTALGAKPAVRGARLQLDLPSQPLASALRMVADRTNTNILFDPAQVKDITAPALAGPATIEEALSRLLAGTQLKYQFMDERTVSVMLAKPIASQSGDVGSERRADSSAMRLARTEAAATPSHSASGMDLQRADNAAPSSAIAEVIVTAQKRTERLQDVPVPVTAISAETLVESNQLRIQDYYTRIPGLNVIPQDFRGAPTLAIRGITTGRGSNPSVGIVVDDVPYGASTNLGGGTLAPDIDPSDLAQVEVLRGPQGTLYGANSMGGLLKFVTADPSTSGFSGRVRAGLSSVHNGDELGYNVRGTANLPMGDAWAARVSGFFRLDPGYIDDPVHGIDGVNRAEASGGRISGLWSPSEDWSLKVSALHQRYAMDGLNDVYIKPGLGDLQQSALPGSGAYVKEFDVYSATLAAKLGDADLTSVSGYSINTLSGSLDFTPGNVAPGQPESRVIEYNKTRKLTQEVRVSIPVGQTVNWLLGVFYTDEDSYYRQDTVPSSSLTGAAVGNSTAFIFPSQFNEYAAFTNLTVQFTDQFDVQLGGRYSRNEQSFFITGNTVAPEVRTDDSSTTYLLTPRFTVSPDLMVYARLASGYRPGALNLLAALLNQPRRSDPDTTQSYEVGIKGEALNQALSFDASLFYIDWKDIQITFTLPGLGAFYSNGSRARSQGVELSLESRPTESLTVALSTAWTDAVLTEDFASNITIYGKSGDRLPFNSRFSGNLSVDQEFAVAVGMTGFLGGAVSFVGDRIGPFKTVASGSPQRQRLPSYVQVDLRAGLKNDAWVANVFVNNVTDRRGVLNGGLGNFNPTAFNYIQPRTVGLSLSRSF